MAAQRFDRNGIPILDNPKDANHLAKNVCHPAAHLWTLVHVNVTADDEAYDFSDTSGTYRCMRCGAMETR